MFIRVLLPFAVRLDLVYRVPPMWIDQMQFGIRVEVPFGKSKVYSALVIATDISLPSPPTRIKSILQPLDKHPIITTSQYSLWKWMANYYCCTLGEVMQAALPSALKLQSQTKLIWIHNDHWHNAVSTDEEAMICDALEHSGELYTDELEAIIGKKQLFSAIEELIRKGLVSVKEELIEEYRDKTDLFISFSPDFQGEKGLREAFDRTRRSDHQTNVLIYITQELRQVDEVAWEKVRRHTKVSKSIIDALEKKGIITIVERKISRLPDFGHIANNQFTLTKEQDQVYKDILSHIDQAHLLFGVTGSGKTQIYLSFIKNMIEEQNGQCLYLVPEIGLTYQFTERLRKICGDELVVYHSRLNQAERVEAWNAILKGKKLILAARSGILLPFQNLRAIIVDEEHDRSYKQQHPAPRYNARDVALYLSQSLGLTTILGSASPSVESLSLAQQGKIKYHHLPNRYGKAQLPEIEVIDMIEAHKKKQVEGFLSHKLRHQIERRLHQGEQVILFHNRRGYVPTIRCRQCGWHGMCEHCDVSLTLHKSSHVLRCHYCGYSRPIPDQCPDCGNPALSEEGLGTEKIEDELVPLFPTSKIKRLDWDTTRGKHKYDRIIQEFEAGEIDILIGTQMVTKGLDFERVGLVGVVQADQLLFFPNFRANEHAMQLLLQVAGRAGRKHVPGIVYIQTYSPDHPVLPFVLSHNYEGFFEMELAQRKQFNYPPFCKMIQIETKHKKEAKAYKAALAIHHFLQTRIEAQLSDVVQAPIPRISNQYLYQIQLKIDRHAGKIQKAKRRIQQAIELLAKQKGFSTVRVTISVDPI